MKKFHKELQEYRRFQSAYTPTILCKNAFEIENDYDLIYVDTPYAKSNKRFQESNYFNFYHLLDAFIAYPQIPELVHNQYSHKPTYDPKTSWYPQKTIEQAFDVLFHKFKDSIIVISYRENGFPSINTLCYLLRKLNKEVKVYYFENYKYALSNRVTREVVVVAQ